MPFGTDKIGEVEVITWGTKDNGGNGLLDQIRAKFYGGNVGHAALRLTIPVDSEGNAEKLIEKYCYQDDQMVLPFTKKTQGNGQEVYEVYISAWGYDSVSLDSDFVADSREEREGVHFEWDPKWVERLGIKPETRRHIGLMGKSIKTYGIKSIVHQRDLSAEQMLEKQEIGELKEYTGELEAVDLLIRRLEIMLNDASKNKKIKLSDTAKILLDRFVPNWKSKVRTSGKLSSNEIQVLMSDVTIRKEEYFSQKSEFLLAMKEKFNLILADIENQIDKDGEEWGRISPELAEKIEALKYVFGFNYDWRGINVEQVIELSLRDMLLLKNSIHNARENLTIEQMIHYYATVRDSQYDLERYHSYGMTPDHIIKLPLKALHETRRNTVGLDAEKMLEKAKEVATSNLKFSLNKTNCSRVAGWVLSAGSQDKRSKSIFGRKALGLISTPQMVFNNAKLYWRNNYKRNRKKHIKRDIEPSIQNSIKIQGFTEIDYNGVDKKLNPIVSAKIVLDRFEQALLDPMTVPYFGKGVQHQLQFSVQNDELLNMRYVKLCNQSIARANQLSRNMNTSIPDAPKANISPQESREIDLKIIKTTNQLEILERKHREAKGELTRLANLLFKRYPGNIILVLPENRSKLLGILSNDGLTELDKRNAILNLITDPRLIEYMAGSYVDSCIKQQAKIKGIEENIDFYQNKMANELIPQRVIDNNLVTPPTHSQRRSGAFMISSQRVRSPRVHANIHESESDNSPKLK